MSRHPHTLLLCILTPREDARTTYRAIVADHRTDNDHDLLLGTDEYLLFFVEDAEEGIEEYQITAPAGSIVVCGMLTEGFREQCPWDEAVRRHDALERWAHAACAQYHCTATIRLSANYW